MATKKKMLQAAAGNAGGEALDITEVFSTYLYDGTGSTQTITNGIDLDGEGGLTWLKARDLAQPHQLLDTERGANYYLRSNTTDASLLASGINWSFNSDGFSMNNNYDEYNKSGSDYVSWTFRKAPRFFDVVTYTGDGDGGRYVSHNLGIKPGFIIFKRTDSASDWPVAARTSNGNVALFNVSTNAAGLNLTAPAFGIYDDSNYWSDSNFAAASTGANISGAQYVAYLFAHDPLGPSGDGSDGLIDCGSYTGNGDVNGNPGQEVELGFEPQWILSKRSNGDEDWNIRDVMRGATTDGTTQRLRPNSSAAESENSGIVPYSLGFKAFGGDNLTGATYIYIAIRRGPMRAPESGTEVFDVDAPVDTSSGHPQTISTGFPVDLSLSRAYTSGVTAGNYVFDRMRGGGVRLETNSTAAEATGGPQLFDRNTSIGNNFWGWNGVVFWNFRRAPGFFDVVAYTGDGTAGRTVPHNLGVAPEMMWVKKRNNVRPWKVYHSAEGSGIALEINTDIGFDSPAFWNDTNPTESVFSVGSSDTVNGSGDTFIAYLFSTLAGISKVGSYTGNGSSQTINCGFTTGARFILIKRTDSTGDWYVWDTARGIVAANDPHLSLNTTAAEVTTDDSIDPDSSGFIVNQVAATNINVSAASYIFYAVS